MHYEVSGIPPEGTVVGSLSVRAWAAVTTDFADLQLVAFEPQVAPPWPSTYKISSQDKAHLTDSDVVGPDGESIRIGVRLAFRAEFPL